MRTRTAIACFVVGCLAGWAPVKIVSAQAARIEAPTLRAGERWTYDQIDPYRRQVVGTLAQTVASTTERQEFGAPYVKLPFPVVPGTKWSERVDAVDAQGRTYAWRIASRARGWERVRTPAGEFDALKITRNMNLGEGDAGWNNTSRTETLWYAPAANGWVRLERRDTQIEKVGMAPRTRDDRRIWELRTHDSG